MSKSTSPRLFFNDTSGHPLKTNDQYLKLLSNSLACSILICECVSPAVALRMLELQAGETRLQINILCASEFFLTILLRLFLSGL